MKYINKECTFSECNNQMHKNWPGLRIPPFLGMRRLIHKKELSMVSSKIEMV